MGIQGFVFKVLRFIPNKIHFISSYYLYMILSKEDDQDRIEDWGGGGGKTVSKQMQF